MMMLFPYQKFCFVAEPTLADLQRKLMLMFEQKAELSNSKKNLGRKGRGRVPLFTGVMEDSQFTVVTNRSGGEEDLVQIIGNIHTGKSRLDVVLTLKPTGTWLTELAGGAVVALVVAFMYGYLGERVFSLINVISWTPYLILLAASLWINLKRYSRRAETLMEQLVYWLELEMPPEDQ